MTIDTSGRWWIGTDYADIVEYLRALTAQSYPATEVRQARCSCGHAAFGLRVDPDEGCAERTCRACGARAFIADSADAASEAELRAVKCPCRGKDFEIGVGFAFRPEGEIRWITVGQRCTSCGVLASSVDWSIDFAPSRHLLEQA
jgi:hypothetical protein